jgi:hypothetical protein
METLKSVMAENTTTLSNPYGYIKDGKVFLKGYMHFPDRQIGEVKLSQEASILYFVRRFEAARQKVEDIYRLVDEAQNKGSYLMKLIHLRQYLEEFDGLGDFPSLFQKLDVLEEQLREMVAHNRVKNLEIKEAMLEEALALSMTDTDWKEASEKIKELKARWIKTGPVYKEEEDRIEALFKERLSAFFFNRKNFFNNKVKLTKDRIRQYLNLIHEAARHKDSTDWDETAKHFKQLHERWKTVGKVPHKKATKLWQDFKVSSDHFFDNYKVAKGIPIKPKVKPIDPRESAQMRICEEIEKILDDTRIEYGSERTKELMMEWRNLNVKPQQQRKDLLERFRLACDRIFETNYLVRVIKRKHPTFEQKPVIDRLRIKTAVMTDLVRKDKQHLEMIEVQNVGGQMDRETETKIAIQRRKIGVKEMLLNEYQQALSELKKKSYY